MWSINKGDWLFALGQIGLGGSFPLKTLNCQCKASLALTRFIFVLHNFVHDVKDFGDKNAKIQFICEDQKTYAACRIWCKEARLFHLYEDTPFYWFVPGLLSAQDQCPPGWQMALMKLDNSAYMHKRMLNIDSEDQRSGAYSPL